ncbi:hypothetical protein [Flagellimonas onchidii]|uniref:hypothetical protein n=1 Tax=Flagellimonas onchidii TaxID=2562684 RepID=UPI0010A5A81F|nr:hypothetical protein [Allomuricauda onchidii]
MSKTIILDRQSIFDIALQNYGNITAVFDMAFANGLSITEELAAGQTILIGENGDLNEPDVLGFYKAHNIKPATGANLRAHDTPSTAIGIGKMSINGTFIVG